MQSLETQVGVLAEKMQNTADAVGKLDVRTDKSLADIKSMLIRLSENHESLRADYNISFNKIIELKTKHDNLAELVGDDKGGLVKTIRDVEAQIGGWRGALKVLGLIFGTSIGAIVLALLDIANKIK